MDEEDFKGKNGNKENRYIPPDLPKHLQAFSPEITIRGGSDKGVTEITVLDLVKDIYSKKLVKFVFFFVAFAILINFWFFRYDDWANDCHINIQFSLLEWNNLEMKRAIIFIKDKSPKDYQTVCKYVDEIALYLPCDSSLGGCFRDSNPKQIGMRTLPRDERGDPSFTASIIYHEACHAVQRAEGRTVGDRETECYKEGYQFLKDAEVPDEEIPENWKAYN